MRAHKAVTVCLFVVLAYAKQLESLLTKKIEAMTVLRGQLHDYGAGGVFYCRSVDDFRY